LHKVDYDDKSWTPAYEIGPNGMQPWGMRPNIIPDAKWIWSAAVREWAGILKIPLFP